MIERQKIPIDPRYTVDNQGNLRAEVDVHPLSGKVGVWIPLDVDDRGVGGSRDRIGRLIGANLSIIAERLAWQRRG